VFEARVPIQTIHSGQHYDFNMSQVFINELQLPNPDHLLMVGSGTYAKQTAELLTRLEPILVENPSAGVLAVGDTNTVFAAALVSSKFGIPFIHLEAGVRSDKYSIIEFLARWDHRVE
jgi:UDP-N-acetylglucosamine 2-epimerase